MSQIQMLDAFSLVRSKIETPRGPNLATKKFEDELLQMKPSDGLQKILEHVTAVPKTLAVCPDVSLEMSERAYLWVVREKDAVHASENCEFGRALGNGRIKHTNLTGGLPAFCGGELLWIDKREVLVNGCSGRYGPRNSEEMQIAAVAFVNAGYRVWSTGFDEGTGFCFKFGASLPTEMVSS